MLAKMKNQLQKEYGVSALVSEVTDMLFLKLVLIYPLHLHRRRQDLAHQCPGRSLGGRARGGQRG